MALGFYAKAFKKYFATPWKAAAILIAWIFYSDEILAIVEPRLPTITSFLLVSSVVWISLGLIEWAWDKRSK